MARKFITGDAELEAALRSLADNAADKIAKSAIGAGLTVLVNAMRKEAPVGATGAVKKSIGKRFERNKKTGLVTAKAGVNVGKRTSNKIGREAPHSHLVILGTKRRKRQTIGGRFGFIRNPTDEQLSTGSGPENPFIRRATEGSTGSVRRAMHEKAKNTLLRDVLSSKKIRK